MSPVDITRLYHDLTIEQFRLLLAGLYPVEFRDFFLGDMYCSLTYFMGVSLCALWFSSKANSKCSRT